MGMTRAEREAEDAKYEEERPMREWQKELKRLDAEMPRWAEDIIDSLSDAARDRIAEETLEKYNLKKEVRRRKPRRT